MGKTIRNHKETLGVDTFGAHRLVKSSQAHSKKEAVAKVTRHRKAIDTCHICPICGAPLQRIFKEFIVCSNEFCSYAEA